MIYIKPDLVIYCGVPSVPPRRPPLPTASVPIFGGFGASGYDRLHDNCIRMRPTHYTLKLSITKENRIATVKSQKISQEK
jgi:hypothetical protein